MKNIVPTEAGEAWIMNDEPWNIRMFTYIRIKPFGRDEPLTLIWSNGTARQYFPEDEHRDIIHGKNGWERINPPVKKESHE